MIKIEEIVPYLPYGLHWQRFIDKPFVGEPRFVTIPNPRILIEHDSTFEVMKSAMEYYDLEFLKPILRPLSDTKKIEFRKLMLVLHSPKKIDNLLKESPINWSYQLLIMCFELHIDVFGLIDRGLAIDINTLEK